MTGTNFLGKRRNLLRPFRKLFPSPTADETCPSSSTSPSTPKTTLSNPTSSEISIGRQSTSGQSLKSDLGARPGSLEQELLDRALQLLTQRERATIQEHILSTADDIDSAFQKAFDAAQEKQNLCGKKDRPPILKHIQ